jgi:hypothetical protein
VNPAYALGRVVAIGEKYSAKTLVELDGSFKFEGLQPDKYRIFVESSDGLCVNSQEYVPSKEVVVEEGKNVEGVEIP